MNDKKSFPAIGVGVITLFTVLIILCVSVFAVLSVVSARADYRISRRNAQTVSDYYAADLLAARAESYAADVIWQKGGDRPDGDVFEQELGQYLGVSVTARESGGGITLSFELPAGDDRVLRAELYMPSGGQCELVSRRLDYSEVLDEPEQLLPVWQG